MRTTAAHALAAANEKQIVDIFRANRAVTVPTAQPLGSLGLNDSAALKKMVVLTIIRRAGPERYYLDERTWAGRRQLRGSTILRIALVLVIVVAAAALFLHGR